MGFISASGLAALFAQIVAIPLYSVPFVHVVCSKVCHPDAVFLHMDYAVFQAKDFAACGGNFEIQAAAVKQFGFLL